MVGDIVTAGRTRGTVASLTKAKVKTQMPGQTPERATCQVVVTHVDGTFESEQTLAVEGRKTAAAIGILSAREAQPWYEQPSFFVHAGDQIYYDFPFPDREPAQKDYRLALSRGMVRRSLRATRSLPLAALHDIGRSRDRRPVREGLRARREEGRCGSLPERSDGTL